MAALYRTLERVRRLAGEHGRDDRGASFVEYAMLIALIVMVCLVGMTVLGESTSARFDDTASRVAAAN